MDPNVETSDISIDPEAKVKKLQDLVKKLEHQNELLRGKQKLQLDSLHNGDTDRNETSDRLIKNVNNNLADSCADQRVPVVGSQDDHELIDLDSMSLKDEEGSWLITVPKKPPTTMQKKFSPVLWVRQVFDEASPEVVSARKTLAYKLEEVARGMGRSPSTPAFSLNRSYTEHSNKGNRMSLSAPVPVTHSSSSLAKPGSGSNIDTSTFTRPKKNREPTSKTGSCSSKFREPRDDVPNVSDIQNLAKLQEESLRQSINSPLGSPRKALKQRQHPPMASVGSHDTENSLSPHSSNMSNRSSPGRFEVSDPIQPRRASLMSSGSQDSVNSPPDSPYGSQKNLQGNKPNGRAESTRRSLPNLTKSNGMPNRLHRSDPSIDDGSADDDDASSVVSESRGGGRSHPAPSGRLSGLKQPMMVRGAMSRQRSRLPIPNRTGIPRPASATLGRSALPTATKRTSIPSAKGVVRNRTPVNHLTNSENKWLEECY